MNDFEESLNFAVQNYYIYNKEYDVMDENTTAVSNNVGLDIGTMNLVAAKLGTDNNVYTTLIRNLFLEVDKNSLEFIDKQMTSHTVIDGKVYVLSDDAYNFANMMQSSVSRPMSKGMISPTEFDAIDILTVMVRSLIGVSQDTNAVCCYSIPANPIDVNMNVIFHESVFGRIISQLGYKPVPLNEATAVVYTECGETNFSGIGISFGAGMSNVAVVFKAVPVLTFSVARGGDWIDENAANSCGLPPNKATQVKEKQDFNLNDFTIGGKKERRIREALIHYYRSLIHYTLNNIVQELNKLNIEFPHDLPIVISGGTSRASGFIDAAKDILVSYEFPFEVSEVRSATNPMTAVAEGCLIRSFKV